MSGERFEDRERVRMLEAVRFILVEAKRLNDLLLSIGAGRSGIEEVAAYGGVQIERHLTAIDNARRELQARLDALYSHLHTEHYAALFPDNWERLQRMKKAA